MFQLPLSGSEKLRKALGQAIIDKIVDKSKSNKDIKGKAFKAYSKQYKESLEFKAAGKTNKVNMTLSGDMLGLMDIIDESRDTITLGWNDNEEAAKAHGHITGSKAGPKVKRDFFGINNRDIKSLKSEFASDINDIKSKAGSSKDQAILAFIKKLGDDGES